MDINKYISSGIIEMYVMGLCSEDEKSELEMLRRQYPELNNAILQYEKELEEKMQQEISLPSSEADERILKSFDSLQKPIAVIGDVADNKMKTMQWLKPAAAAAVILLAVSSYFNYTLFKKNRKQEQVSKTGDEKGNIPTLPLADYNIMKNPTITPVAMYGVGLHAICRCTMFWDKKTGKIYMMIHHLPESSAGKDYQLWAMVNNKPVNVSVFKADIRGRFIELKSVPAGTNGFIVTLEKTGGSQSPTVDETYLKGDI